MTITNNDIERYKFIYFTKKYYQNIINTETIYDIRYNTSQTLSSNIITNTIVSLIINTHYENYN
jgi:hypothetical protein